jgi:type IV fimbrial biogenesis protein FimT
MKGFTVLEAMIVLAIAAIVALAAWPSFAALLAEHRRIVAVNALVGTLQHARHAAVSRARAVSVCAAGPHPARCGDDWGRGWLAFIEPRGWRVQQPVPAAAVVHRAAVGTGIAIASNRGRYRFRPHGRATNGTFVLCSADRDADARLVVVSATGRVRNAAAARDRCPD